MTHRAAGGTLVKKEIITGIHMDDEYIGKLNKQIYSCVMNNIALDDVVITAERIQHIIDRHPMDYERFMSYIPSIISEPDFIIEANRPHTAVILKEILADGEKFKLILRLRVESDPADYKNSVLSFWRIGDTTWDKALRNKKILYRRT